MLKNKINVYFSNNMQKVNTSFSPSAAKPEVVIEDWKNNFRDQFLIRNFYPFKKEQLKIVHSSLYVDEIFDGIAANGFGLKDADFASTFLYTNASLYYAALDALKNKVSISPTSGFHHAGFKKANGFCTFNGLIITSMLLKKEQKVKKIGILDCDMHYGNGTEELIKKHKLDYIEHYTAGKYYDLHYPALEFLKPLIKKLYHASSSSTPKFRQWILKNKGEKFIKELPQILKKFEDCDLIIYQAGADQHIDDPYGGLLTYEQMIARDKAVFEFAQMREIPIVWNLAGGYQRDNEGSIAPVLKCHRNTMEACLQIFSQ